MKLKPAACGDILIVDDNPDNLNLLSDLLRDQGYRVRPAPNGRLALQAVALAPPDLILLDVMMPDMDGYEVCRQLKTDVKTREIPVIFLTALDGDFDEERGLALGAVDFLSKPIRSPIVRARVHNHLQLKFRRDQLGRAVRERTAELQHSHDAQSVLNRLLCLAMEDLSLEDLPGRALDIILETPWLAHESRGCLFLVEEEPGILVMKAQRGLSESIRQECAKVPFRHCFCGRAGAERKILFDEGVDAQHAVADGGMGEHGHCCVPITAAETLLGVLTLYLRKGDRREPNQERFFLAVADTLALIIQHKRSEDQIRRNLQEKMALLEEVHHRVRNNLQVILSLMTLQAPELNETTAKDAYLEIAKKVRAMALIHEKLSRTPNLSLIGVADYLRELVGYTLSECAQTPLKVSLDLDTADCRIDLKKAIPFGLLVNEFLSASLRVAKAEAVPFEIRLALTNEGGRTRLQIGSDRQLFRTTPPLGPDAQSLMLMQILAGQLESPLEMERKAELSIFLDPIGGQDESSRRSSPK